MTLPELKAKADAKLVTFWQFLVPKQDAYFAKHGKYFQLLVTPSNAVIDGLDSDFTNNIPSDEKFVIDREFSFATKIPFNIRVNEWVGTGEAGYNAIVVVQLPDGRRFGRERNNLNEDTGWSLLDPTSQ